MNWCSFQFGSAHGPSIRSLVLSTQRYMISNEDNTLILASNDEEVSRAGFMISNEEK